MGLTLAGVVGDSACSSHLTQPSNWAPHDLTLVAKHVLGRPMPDDDEVLGTGRARKKWSGLSLDRAAEIAGQRADASAAISAKLTPGVEPALLTEYLELEDTLVRMELTGLMVDRAELERAEASFATIEKELDTQIEALAGHTFNINSSKQLGAVLFEELKLPIVSHTKTGWSTANEAHRTHLRRAPHRAARAALERSASPARFVAHLASRLHRHPTVACTHASTSRARSRVTSSTRTPDLGRVPGRTPEMSRVRRAFVAPPRQAAHVGRLQPARPLPCSRI